jgi:hypothetical protein
MMMSALPVAAINGTDGGLVLLRDLVAGDRPWTEADALARTPHDGMHGKTALRVVSKAIGELMDG